MAILLVDLRLQLLAQDRQALRDRVSVLAGANGVDARLFDRLGTSKSGWPIEKLIGSFILAARSKTLRMPLESKARVRSARTDMIVQSSEFKVQS